MLGKTFLLHKYVLFVKSKYKYAPFDDKHNMELLAYKIHISETYYKLSTNCKRAFMDQKPQAFIANTVTVLGSNPGSLSPTQ
jgi:hypothetical protein